MWKYIENQEENDIILTKFSTGLNYLNIETNICEIEKLNKNQKLIISLSHIWNIDVDWIEALDEMIDVLLSNNIDVYLSWVSEVENYYLKLHNYNKLLNNNKVFASTSESLNFLLNK